MNDDTTAPEWLTVPQAATEVGKSTQTIRRWTTLYGSRLRSRTRLGATQVYRPDLVDLAKTLPPSAPYAEDCAAEGHLPDTPDNASPKWITAAEAADLVGRTKRTVLRWAAEGRVRSAPCACGRRRYIWNPTATDTTTSTEREDHTSE